MVTVHDKGQVQVVGRLSQQVDLLFLKGFHDRAEFVEDGPDAPPHERYRGTVTDDIDAADTTPEVLGEGVNYAA